MTRKLNVAVGLWLLVAGAALSQVDPRVEAFSPATKEQASAAIQPTSPAGAAGELQFTARCLDTNPREGLIALSWSPAPTAGLAQRVDVSKLHEGFATGRFEASRQLEAGLTAVGLQAPEPGINYYWRVLTATPGGWVSSPVSRFEAPVCPSDGPVFRNEEVGNA